MKKCLIIFALLLTSKLWAISLKDYAPYEFEVFFTNPVCDTYLYDTSVISNDGTVLFSKPKNVYCKSSDFDQNILRDSSPLFQILKVINDKDVSELFLTYLSYSEDKVTQALCDAIQNRQVKVSFIIDSNSETRSSARKELDVLKSCGAQTYFRGNLKGIGYAHNKLILAKYKSDINKRKIVFSSGNMSAGTILHHENWSFVTTNKNSYFSQTHDCLEKAMIDHADSKKEFKNYLKTCRLEISSEEESDIKTFFVPSDGDLAMKKIQEEFLHASEVNVAVHRFTHPDLINSMKEASENGKNVRFISDDDIYWAGVRGKTTGSNMKMEFYNVMKLVNSKVRVRYMETNQNSKLLHHNKFIVFNKNDGSSSVFTGAGNFTKAAFSKNMENYYFITIPEVAEKYKKQYEYMFNELATTWEKMPSEYVNP